MLWNVTAFLSRNLELNMLYLLRLVLFYRLERLLILTKICSRKVERFRLSTNVFFEVASKLVEHLAAKSSFQQNLL